MELQQLSSSNDTVSCRQGRCELAAELQHYWLHRLNIFPMRCASGRKGVLA
jgi:hypothetical protein